MMSKTISTSLFSSPVADQTKWIFATNFPYKNQMELLGDELETRQSGSMETKTRGAMAKLLTKAMFWIETQNCFRMKNWPWFAVLRQVCGSWVYQHGIMLTSCFSPINRSALPTGTSTAVTKGSITSPLRLRFWAKTWEWPSTRPSFQTSFLCARVKSFFATNSSWPPDLMFLKPCSGSHFTSSSFPLRYVIYFDSASTKSLTKTIPKLRLRTSRLKYSQKWVIDHRVCAECLQLCSSVPGAEIHLYRFLWYQHGYCLRNPNLCWHVQPASSQEPNRRFPLRHHWCSQYWKDPSPGQLTFCCDLARICLHFCFPQHATSGWFWRMANHQPWSSRNHECTLSLISSKAKIVLIDSIPGERK